MQSGCNNVILYIAENLDLPVGRQEEVSVLSPWTRLTKSLEDIVVMWVTLAPWLSLMVHDERKTYMVPFSARCSTIFQISEPHVAFMLNGPNR